MISNLNQNPSWDGFKYKKAETVNYLLTAEFSGSQGNETFKRRKKYKTMLNHKLHRSCLFTGMIRQVKSTYKS